MAKEKIMCKNCEFLEKRKTLKETNRGSGVYTQIGSHEYCTVTKSIMTPHEVATKGCTRGKERKAPDEGE